LSKQIILFANFEIDKRSDSGSNFVANDTGTTSTNRVLATDLMRVSTELGNLGYNTGAYQGLHILILIKELLNLIGILMTTIS
jgi:hypothetical protein